MKLAVGNRSGADGDSVNELEARTKEPFFFGEVPEGLPGSTKSVACMERNVVELARPERSCGGAGRRTRSDE